jgi:hypothetical protein
VSHLLKIAEPFEETFIAACQPQHIEDLLQLLLLLQVRAQPRVLFIWLHHPLPQDQHDVPEVLGQGPFQSEGTCAAPRLALPVLHRGGHHGDADVIGQLLIGP